MSWSNPDKRRRVLALVVAAAALLAIGGWTSSLVIESPREAAANAAAPAPSLITVPVESRHVGAELVTRGLVKATQTVEAISPLAGSGADRALISGHVPRAGASIKAGEVVVEISGRPVIALQGAVPAFRSLGPGDTGSDVQRLNAALASAGLGTDRRSAEYTDATVEAVKKLYRRAGYGSDGSLPSSEVAFVSALPASVVSVAASLGASVDDSSITIASGDLTVAASFPSAQAALIQPGAKVVISSEILGKSVDATVEADTAAKGAGGDSAGGPTDEGAGSGRQTGDTSYSIVPDKPLGSQWAGQDVKVRVVSATTDAEVLAVPVTAIVENGSGDTEVVVVDKGATSIADANPRRVKVVTGVTGGGWVQVTPAGGASLQAGDPVQLSASTSKGLP